MGCFCMYNVIMVKYLIAQDTGLRFQWEIDVLLTNLYSLDAKADVVLLFCR